MIEIGVVWIALAVVTAIVAASKGRNALAWLLVALLISGVLGLILVALMPALTTAPVEVRNANDLQPGESKTCPQCAEPVRRAAKICRYCQYEFTLEDEKSLSTQPEQIFDQRVFVRPSDSMFGNRRYEAHIHGTVRRFASEEEAVQHIVSFRTNRSARRTSS